MPDDTRQLLGTDSELVAEFLASHARASYNRGLLRVLLPGGDPDLVEWDQATGWKADWPVADGLVAIMYDWLGRLYAVDRAGTSGPRGELIRVVPGTGDLEATDMGVEEWLLEELPAHYQDLLSEDYHLDWLASGGRQLAPNECAGYKVPLLLGGEDDIDNLEVTSLRVYLSLCGQLAAQALGPDAVDQVRADERN